MDGTSNYEISFAPVGGWSVVVVAGVVLVALLVLAPARDLSRKRQFILALLRTSAILLMLFALMRVTLVYPATRKQPATLIVLIDKSISMTMPDGGSKGRRWDEMRAALVDARGAIVDLPEELEVRAYTFDAEANRTTLKDGVIDLPDEPDGKQSAIGAALADILRLEAGKRLAGVILLSDGAQRAQPSRNLLPDEPARRLRDLGCPLFTVPFGEARAIGDVRDLALDNLQDNSPVFEKNPLNLQVDLRAYGFASKTVTVRLWFEDVDGEMQLAPQSGQDKTQAHVAIPTTVRDPLGPDGKPRRTSGGAVMPVDLTYTPTRTGEFKVVVEAIPQPGEAVTTNNRVTTFVTVRKGGLKVLYLTGVRRLEERFLRRGLESSPDINCEFVYIDPRSPEKTRPADLNDRLKPGHYDVFIIADLDSRALDAEGMKNLVESVKQGAGLLMTGGFHNFGGGGWQHTPLKGILPIVMDPTEKQDLDGPIIEDLQVKGPLVIRPTEAGLKYRVMQLLPGPENNTLWQKLTLEEGGNRFRGLTENAIPLATASDEKTVLLAVRSAGSGTVLAFAGDSTWRWWMKGFEAAYKRFWRQVILFLARKDDTANNNVWVKLEKRRFRPGERIDFTAGARTPEGQVIVDAEFSATIRHSRDAEGKRLDATRAAEARLARQGEEVRGSYSEAEEPGDYEVVVTARGKTGPIGEAVARLNVYEQDLERDRPLAERDQMISLAEITQDKGGRMIPPEQLANIFEEVKERQHELELPVPTKATLWDRWEFFLLFCGIMITEWWLRKRWRLV